MNFPLQFQPSLSESLAALWNGGRFPHTLLLEGEAGSGKDTLARFLAAELLCRRSAAEAPCGNCPSCHKLSTGNHPDFTVLLPDEKSKTASITIDQVRAIKTDAYLAPHEAARRVYYIPHAEGILPAAQNALLKLIEEPPEAAYFIFTVESRGALLETVRSRATILTLSPLAESERRSVLERLRPEQAGLASFAKAYPTVGQALAALEDPAARARTEAAAAFLDAVRHCERYECMRLLLPYEKDRPTYLAFLQLLRGGLAGELSSGGLSALQCSKILDIIEETAERCEQNGTRPLLSAVMAGRLVKTGYPS